MEWIPAVLDADIQQTQCQEGDIGIAVVDVANDRNGSLPRRIALLGIDQVRNFEAQRQIWLEVLGRAGVLDVALERCGGGFGREGEAVSRGVSGGGCFHGEIEMAVSRSEQVLIKMQTVRGQCKWP